MFAVATPCVPRRTFKPTHPEQGGGVNGKKIEMRTRERHGGEGRKGGLFFFAFRRLFFSFFAFTSGLSRRGKFEATRTACRIPNVHFRYDSLRRRKSLKPNVRTEVLGRYAQNGKGRTSSSIRNAGGPTRDLQCKRSPTMSRCLSKRQQESEPRQHLSGVEKRTKLIER